MTATASQTHRSDLSTWTYASQTRNCNPSIKPVHQTAVSCGESANIFLRVRVVYFFLAHQTKRLLWLNICTFTDSTWLARITGWLAMRRHCMSLTFPVKVRREGSTLCSTICYTLYTFILGAYPTQDWGERCTVCKSVSLSTLSKLYFLHFVGVFLQSVRFFSTPRSRTHRPQHRCKVKYLIFIYVT